MISIMTLVLVVSICFLVPKAAFLAAAPLCQHRVVDRGGVDAEVRERRTAPYATSSW